MKPCRWFSRDFPTLHDRYPGSLHRQNKLVALRHLAFYTLFFPTEPSTMSFGTMLVHTTNAWEDQTCPAEQWDDFNTDYSRYDDGFDFGADLSLSVDVCASYENPELFSLSSLDDFGLPALSCTTLLVEAQPERPRKRLRDTSDVGGLPSKKLRTADVEQPLAPPALPVSGLIEKESGAVLLPSPEMPSAPSSPNEPASSPSCVSPKALFSPVSEYASSTNDFGFGDLMGFDDVYVPRRRTTRAQSKLLQPLAPTKKQRNKLARDIATLTVDKLQEIVQLVYPNVGHQQGDIEVEFDIADVDDKLFHSLREFVDSCTKNTQESADAAVQKRTCLPSSPKSLSSSNDTMNSTSPLKSSSVPSPTKSAKPSRKRPRKGKKTKAQPEPQPAPVAVPRSLTQAEVVIFECQEVLTLAQTESAEEDEFVDIGE